jgi:transposase
MRRYEISEKVWQRLAPLLPGKASDRGRTATDTRLFLHACVSVRLAGWPWRDLPARFGPWNSAARRFRRWAQPGVWQRVFEAVAQEPDGAWVLLDSTSVRVPPLAAGQTKAPPPPPRQAADAAGGAPSGTPPATRRAARSGCIWIR